jgi:hypothetical protein
VADHLGDVIANEVDLLPILLRFLEDVHLARPILLWPVDLDDEVISRSKFFVSPSCVGSGGGPSLPPMMLVPRPIKVVPRYTS